MASGTLALTGANLTVKEFNSGKSIFTGSTSGSGGLIFNPSNGSINVYLELDQFEHPGQHGGRSGHVAGSSHSLWRDAWLEACRPRQRGRSSATGPTASSIGSLASIGSTTGTVSLGASPTASRSGPTAPARRSTASSLNYSLGLHGDQGRCPGHFTLTNVNSPTCLRHHSLQVSGGTAFLNPSSSGNPIPVQVNSGGTFRATSGVSTINVASGGTLGLGTPTAPGSLTTSGNVTLNPGSNFAVRFTTSGDDIYDGGATGPTLTITNANLALSIGSGEVLVLGSPYPIIYNTRLTGTFAGLPNNALLTAGGYAFRITYTVSGSLTDVYITRVSLSTTVGVSSSQSPSTYGQSVAFTANLATVSGGPTPTGTVQFQVDGTNFGTPVTLVNGSATSNATSGLSVGSHTINANYSGDSSYSGMSGTTGQTVNASTVPVVGDSGFETVNVGNSFAIDPTGSAWTFSGVAGNGSGVSGNNSPFTSGNPNAPQGTQVGYLQTKGTITQSVAGWLAGTYAVSFDAAQRGNNGTSVEDFEVLIDGVVVGAFKPTSTSYQVYTTGPFTVTAGSHAIEFLGLDTAGGDNTVFLDAVSVAVSTSTVPTVGDSGFETVNVGNSFAIDPTGSAWTFSGVAGNGSGVSGNNSPFTSGNPNAPQGTQVGYLQTKGTITQSVAGWLAGTYTVSFDAAQRGNNGTSVEDFEVLIDGVVVGAFKPTSTSYQVYTTGPFTVTAGSHTIEFLGLDTAGGDNTVFLDAVSVAVSTSSVPTVGDSGFETVNVGNSFAIDPTGSAWTFSGVAGNGSGVSGNNSPFTSGNPNAPQGTQVGYLQTKGTITQSVAGWAAGTYTVSFDAAQRGNNGTSVEDFEVLIDGVVVGTFKPTSSSYQVYTTGPFTVTAGSHAIEFLGLDTAGGDNTVFLDAVSIAVSTSSVPTVGDSGFETVNVGNSFAIDPTGSAWTFSGVAGNGSGVAGNNSAFTSGNPNAPQGTQVGYIEAKGSITQSVAGWAAGNYTISFDAAQRGNFGTSVEDFEVLIDGVVVGTFKPTSTSYQVYTTGPFTVTAGAHAIEFLGLDTAGGDNTVFLDAVSIATSNAPVVGDSGFETVNVGNSFAVDPTGSAWTFSGVAGNGSGVSGNNSPFTSGNPNAPQGSQVAFIERTGSITQSVAGWAAGNFTLSLDAAQRGNFGGVEDFEVLIDGTVVGTFKPTSTSYQVFTTSTFTVTAGAHTIELLGINTAGGDDTAFIDSVSIASA